MRTRTTVSSLLAVLACGTLWSPACVGRAGLDPAQAHPSAPALDYQDRDCEHDRVRSLTLRGEILSLQELLKRVRRHRRGRVLDIELQKWRAGYIYELLLVDDRGRVWEMKLDAASGELLEQHGED